MLETLWILLKAAVLDAAKEKVSEMTKDEAKELLDKIGVKVEEITDDVAKKVAEFKDGLDAETRRAVRPYWIALCVIAFVFGCGIGYLFA